MVRTVDGKKKPFGDSIVWTPKKISSKGMKLSVDEMITRANDEAVASGVDLEVLEPNSKNRIKVSPMLNELALGVSKGMIPQLIRIQNTLKNLDDKLMGRIENAIRTGDKSAQLVLANEVVELRLVQNYLSATIKSLDFIDEKILNKNYTSKDELLPYVINAQSSIRELSKKGGKFTPELENKKIDSMNLLSRIQDNVIGYDSASYTSPVASDVTQSDISKILKEAKDKAGKW
jgi:hypothetical protein